MARLKISKPKLGGAEPASKRRLVMSGATLCCALGIGYVMQFGLALPGQSKFSGPVKVDNITMTSSAASMPKLPGLKDDVTLASVEFTDTPRAFGPKIDENGLAAPASPAPVQNEVIAAPACDITMTATPTAGAMVDLALDAPCNGLERLTIHHHGMMFTEVADVKGKMEITVPVLSEKAVFVASFASGDGASATTEVNSLSFYDRVVVQWKGAAGLQLHAREFEASYFDEGHIWADDMGDLGVAARGEGGFLMRLGLEDAPDALMAEIYSFPTGTARRSGDVALSVEAEVTSGNCDSEVEAQTFELRPDDRIEVHDLVLNMPDCDAVGDFLVLKNLLEDLTIAGR